MAKENECLCEDCDYDDCFCDMCSSKSICTQKGCDMQCMEEEEDVT